MKKVLVCLTTILGLWLRLKASLSLSFWNDEASIFFVSLNNSLKSLIIMSHWDKSHPQLFYIFIHFWQQLDHSIMFLRFPSLFAYIPTSILIYLIAKKIGNWQTGILASVFFAVNPFFVNLGFQQKMYAFELLFMMSTIYWAIRLIHSRTSSLDKKIPIYFIVSAVMGFYTDYSFVWLWLSFWLAVIGFTIIKKQDRQQILLVIKPGLIASCFMALQIPIFLSGLHQALILESYLDIPTYSHIRFTAAGFMGLSQPFSGDLLLVICLALFSLAFANQRHHAYQQLFIWWMLLALCVSLSIAYIVSQSTPIFLARNLIASSFLYLFGIPYAITQIPQNGVKIIIASIFFVYITNIAKTTLKYDQVFFQGVDPLSRYFDVARKINAPITLLLISQGDYKLSSLKDYYFAGFYDGSSITNYNQIYINPKMLDQLTIPNTDQIFKNVMIFADNPYVSNQSQILATIQSTICAHRYCYGPFALQ